MARCEERNLRGWRHRSGREPFPTESRAPSWGRESDPLPACPSYVWDQQVSAVFPDYRPLFEGNAPEPVTQETLSRRPFPEGDVLPEGKGKLFNLPFPQKLWKIVNSSKFASICWDDGGTYIGINEKLFQKEILGRSGSNKVFETDSMKSFVRQLNLYGFSKMRQDTHTSFFLTSFFALERPVYIVSKLQFYYNPYFKRDSPHLLKRIKRRVGIKSTLRHVGSKPECPESSPGTRATAQEEDRASGEVANQELPHDRGSTSATTQVPVESAAPAPCALVPEPTRENGDPATVTEPAQGQPEGGQEPLTLVAGLTVPAEFPFICLTIPSPQVTSYGPMAGPPAVPPGGILHVHPPHLPFPALLPCYCHPWMPVPIVAAGPVAPVSSFPHPSTPLHCCPNCHCVSEYMPAISGSLMYPHYTYHQW